MLGEDKPIDMGVGCGYRCRGDDRWGKGCIMQILNDSMIP